MVKAEWRRHIYDVYEKHGEVIYCSECGMEWSEEALSILPCYGSLADEYDLPNYCPNCGAEMWNNYVPRD